MRMAWWVVPVAVFVSGCAHRFECTAHGGRVVRQVETQHFIVTSDLDEEVLLQQARELEQLWTSWCLFFRHQPETSAKLQVLLSEQGATDEFAEGYAGFVRYSAEPLMISDVRRVEGYDKVRYYSSNAHEMAHFVSHFWLRRQPRWLAEGLANYLDDADFIREGTVRMGRWQWAGTSVDSLETMWAWDQMRESGPTEGDRYQSAWAWFHFFSNKEEARLTRWLAALRTARSPLESFEAIFPREEWETLHERLVKYLSEGRYRGWETRNLETPELSTPRVLEPWEVHLIRGRYLDNGKLTHAEVELAATLAAPKRPADVTLAQYEATRGPQRSEVLAELPDDPRAWLVASFAPDLPLKERLQLAARAMEQRPTDVWAQARFAELAVLREDPRALAAADRAIVLAPWWDTPYFLRSSALVQQGRCADALSTIEDVRGLSSEGNSTRKRADEAEAAVKKDCKEAAR
ncbi:MAG: hypothetical protein ACO1OB_17235 [Archangium sp.]